MKAARTHGTHSLVAALHAAKPGVGQLGGLESFQTRMQGALTPDGIAGLAQKLAGGKGKALKDGEAADEASAAKPNAAGKKGGVANDAAAKEKAKHLSKLGDDASIAADGAGSAMGADANGLPVTGPMGNLQPVEAGKKDVVDPNAPAINSASTSTLQQPSLPLDIGAGPVEITATKQVEASVAESKTKRVSASAIAALSDRPAVTTVNVDGSMGGMGANGIAIGGVGGQGMQGGHSSGSAGHSGQPPASHAAAGVGPQVVASTPSQLDVGVYDDTHGWLRIRAELGAGGAVNASLTSADAAHESLKTALPEMTHYLGTEAVHVNTIELHKFGDAAGGQAGSHTDGHQQQSSMAGQDAHGDEQRQSGAQANVMAALEDMSSRSAGSVPETNAEVEVQTGGAVPDTSVTVGVGAVSAASSVSGTVPDAELASGPVDDIQMADMLGTQFLPWQVGVGGSGGWVNVSA